MLKIFALDKFPCDENRENTLGNTTPEEYLEKMLSCVENGELIIAKKKTKVSVDLAENLDKASYADRYKMDLSKADAAAIVAKEKEIFEECGEIARKRQGREETLAAVQTVVREKIDREGLRVENVENRAQRLEKLLELGAPELIVNSERRYLIEELALNAYATKSTTTYKYRPLFGMPCWRFMKF